MKKLTNQGKSWVCAVLTFVLYCIPFAVLVIMYNDKIFKNTTNQLTLFSILIIVFCLIFAKKVVKKLAFAFTPLLFGSVIGLVIVCGLQCFFDDLRLILFTSCVGSVLAWYPYQLTVVYNKHAFDEKGDVVRTTGLTLKQANSKIFQISIFSTGEDK